MMKRTLQLSAKMKDGTRWIFLAMIALSMNVLSAQDNDSLCIDFNLVSIPSGTATIGDSICYQWKITNKTQDTLRNVMLIDASIPNVTVPVLLPFGQMSASGSALTGSGSFMFTGSGCPMITPGQLNSGFAAYTGKVTAEVSGTPTYCSSSTGYACFGVTFSCINMNISVNAKCETMLTPRLMNVNTTLPDSVIRIRIEESPGVYRDPPLVGVDDVGKSLKVVVDAPVCGTDVAPCWSYANIEYKLGPEIICSSDTISCAMNVAMNDPIVVDACGNTEFIRLGTTRTDLCQLDTMFLAVDTVIYAVRDQFGNVSDTCRQLRYIKKPNLKFSDIDFPSDTTVSCETLVLDEDGNLPLDFAKVPTWDGVSVLDINRANCNVFAERTQFLDVRMQCNNVEQVTRRITLQWKIYEWKCEGGVNEITGPLYTISFVDNTPPVISGLPGKLRFNVDDFECNATFTPPVPTVEDACNNDFTSLDYRFLGMTLPNEGQAVKLPPGVHNLEYIARDGCGNSAIDTIEVTVVDESIPVAICLKENQISISDDFAYLRATDIDQDSYDPCGLDSIKIRRSGTYCADSPQDTMWQDMIKFCCDDINEDISVGLRVYSKGNWNECWIKVFVKGGSEATVTCLPDTIVMTCEYTYDENNPQSLEIFGTLEEDLNPDTILLPANLFVRASGPLRNGTVSNACGAKILELPPIVDIDSFCRTGTIDRRIQVTDATGKVTICHQRIVIEGDQLANPASFIYVPANDTLNGMDGRTLESLAKNDPAVVMNNGCSMVGVGYRDRVFKIEPSDYCAKVVRSWFLIDWCRNGAVPVDTAFQYIYIDDNEAPVISPLNARSIVLPAAINVVVEDAVASDIDDLNISFVISGAGGTVTKTLDRTNATFTDDKVEFVLDEVLPVGDYTLTWTITDPCGNPATQSQALKITTLANLVEVVGQVLFSNGGVMDQVEVHLTEEESIYTEGDMDLTDNDGSYEFMTATAGKSYYVDPVKDDDILNGVTTLDLLKIQRHVLNITPLTDPKLKIAADINNDGKISAFDLVDLRKVILGKSKEFTNNDSWTFVYDGQNLEDIFLYGDEMMRRYHIPSLEGKMSINFEGIKIGDISGDAVGHSAGLAGGRSLSTVELGYRIEQVGKESHVIIEAMEATTISALQAELSWITGQTIARVESGKLEISADQYNVIDPTASIRLSHTSNSDQTIVAGERLFTIVLDANASGEIAITESWMNAEVYTSTAVKGISLKEIASDISVLRVSQNTPNPWSTSTVIAVEIPQAGEATLSVYDMHSRLIISETRLVQKGTHLFEIDNSKITETGMYFYEVEAAGQRAHEKMLRVD